MIRFFGFVYFSFRRGCLVRCICVVCGFRGTLGSEGSIWSRLEIGVWAVDVGFGVCRCFWVLCLGVLGDGGIGLDTVICLFFVGKLGCGLGFIRMLKL